MGYQHEAATCSCIVQGSDPCIDEPKPNLLVQKTYSCALYWHFSHLGHLLNVCCRSIMKVLGKFSSLAYIKLHTFLYRQRKKIVGSNRFETTENLKRIKFYGRMYHPIYCMKIPYGVSFLPTISDYSLEQLATKSTVCDL